MEERKPEKSKHCAHMYMVHRGPREQSAIIKYDETVAIKPPLRSIVSRVFAENLLAKTHRLKDEEDGVHLESKILYRDSCPFSGLMEITYFVCIADVEFSGVSV